MESLCHTPESNIFCTPNILELKNTLPNHMLSGLIAGYIRKKYSMTYGIWSFHGTILDILLKKKNTGYAIRWMDTQMVEHTFPKSSD